MPPAFGNGQAVVSEEAMQEKHANRTGDLSGLELKSRGKSSNGNLILVLGILGCLFFFFFFFLFHSSRLTN